MTAQPVRRSSGRHSSAGFRSPVRKRRAAWLDWLAGTDPGLMRLRLATEVVCTIGVVLAAEWGFVRGTGALLLPVPARAPSAVAAELASANHALTVIAMVLGAIVAMISGFGMTSEVGARSQLVTCLFLAVPLLATLALGLSLHARAASLALMAVLLAAGTYCRRFGPRGFTGGVLAFIGAFLGFFVQDLVTVADMGWLAAEIGLGVAVTIAVHFTLFRPHPAAALRRMQRSYAARAHDLASDVADQFAAVAGVARFFSPRARREEAAAPPAAPERDHAARRRAAGQPGGRPRGLERGHAAPAPVRRGSGARQHGAVRPRDRQAAIPGVCQRAGGQRPGDRPLRGPGWRAGQRGRHPDAARHP